MNVNVLEAVRNLLIADGGLIALVPARQVVFARGVLPTDYPSIALSEDLLEDGNEFNLEGLFYVRIYTQDADKDQSLSDIHNVVFPLIGRQGAILNATNGTVTFHECRQVFTSESVREPEVDINTWSTQTNYTMKVTI